MDSIDKKLDTFTGDLNNLTREQAIDLVGTAEVERVEGENCEWDMNMDDYTSRWVAYVQVDDGEQKWNLSAYYYADNEEINYLEDLGDYAWVIDHYSLG